MAYLKHLVWAGLNARDEVRRTESRLLHFGKVVLWVTIESKASNWNQRIFSLWPDLAKDQMLNPKS